jgi:hypothetical protein
MSRTNFQSTRSFCILMLSTTARRKTRIIVLFCWLDELVLRTSLVILSQHFFRTMLSTSTTRISVFSRDPDAGVLRKVNLSSSPKLMYVLAYISFICSFILNQFRTKLLSTKLELTRRRKECWRATRGFDLLASISLVLN